MANLKTVAQVLLYLNFCMYAIVLGIGGWAVNRAIDHHFDVGTTSANQTGKGIVVVLPPHFSPIYFPMGNAATGFFVVFALITATFGLASAISGFNHVNHEGSNTLPSATGTGILAWALTLLTMGFASKEIDLSGRNGRLITMEAFIIILSATQLFYVAAINKRGGAGAQKK